MSKISIQMINSALDIELINVLLTDLFISIEKCLRFIFSIAIEVSRNEILIENIYIHKKQRRHDNSAEIADAASAQIFSWIETVIML